MSTLDTDLIFTEILPRLPVKSLMRFKCVSKSFNFEISSSNFSQLHHRYHSLSSDDDQLILLGEKRILCYDHNFATSICTPTSTFNWNGADVHGVGSCNGLLCVFVRNNGQRFSVLNPTTRIYQDIRIRVGDVTTGYYMGFAFDPSSFDYKIVCITMNNESKPDTQITKVYSLNANSWTILEFLSPIYTLYAKAQGTLIDNNLLHWAFWIPSVSRHRISCFDVSKNEWTDVPFPHYYNDPNHNISLCEIAVINENLCSSFNNTDNSCFEVWMMNEYGVQDSWVKLLSIPKSNCLPWGLTPIAQNRRSSRLLIRMYFSPRVLWCDLSGGGRTEVTFDGAELASQLPIFICKRSLVQLPDGHRFPYP